MITNNDLKLLGLVKDFIEDLGIHCFIYPHSNKRAFILEIVGKNNVRKFLDIVKPCIKNSIPPQKAPPSYILKRRKILTCPYCGGKIVYSRKYGLIKVS